MSGRNLAQGSNAGTNPFGRTHSRIMPGALFSISGCLWHFFSASLRKALNTACRDGMGAKAPNGGTGMALFRVRCLLQRRDSINTLLRME